MIFIRDIRAKKKTIETKYARQKTSIEVMLVCVCIYIYIYCIYTNITIHILICIQYIPSIEVF